MTQDELIARFEAEQHLYDAWGRLVTDRVCTMIAEELGSRAAMDAFVRVSPGHRTKTVDSLVEKAYYRGKGYQAPYDQITDKVGTRFVVLLLDDIEVVERAINTVDLWDAQKDRDFEAERLARPTLFDYQSVHYVVRAREGASDGTHTFRPGMACEIQVRTLMQHAFSELTHDTIYKPLVLASPEVRRNVAKSMALIEVADHLFQEVSMKIRETSDKASEVLGRLDVLYRKHIGREPREMPRASSFLLNKLGAELPHVDWEALETAARHPSMRARIEREYDRNFLYRQATILLVYHLAEKRSIALKQAWPYTLGELDPVLADLGLG